jgi:hypothetical protein
MSARYMWPNTWTNFCDGAGRFKVDLLELKIRIFPGDNFSLDEINGFLNELITVGLVGKYTVDGIDYIETYNWKKHQRTYSDEKITTPEPPKKKVGSGREEKLEVFSTLDAQKPNKELEENATEFSTSNFLTSSSSFTSPSPSTDGVKNPEIKIPEEEKEKPENRLSRLWVIHLKRRKNRAPADDPADIAPIMRSILDAGKTEEQISAEIIRADRDHTEYDWQFKVRMLPRSPPNGNGNGSQTRLTNFGQVVLEKLNNHDKR